MAHSMQSANADPKDSYLFDVAHQTKMKLCAVMSNNIGETVYAFILEDAENLTEPVGFELRVQPDGSTEYRQVNPEELIELLAEDESIELLSEE